MYTALLEIGQTSAGEIIKKTGLHRSVVYETLDKLIARKLVFKLEKQKIAFYQATDPSRLLQNIKSQEEIAMELIPKLTNFIDTKLPEITIYEGLESYRAFWLAFYARVEPGSTDYIAGSIGSYWQELLGIRTIEKILQIQVERKIKWKALMFSKDPIEMEWFQRSPELYECRLINKNGPAEGNYNITSEGTVLLHSATEPMIIEIKNPTLFRVFQNIFDTMWDIAKPLNP